ncbi:MAG: RdgB/HAM1 family non-canonical purine NTP pyrophosphatase [Candidatus Margulisiibacteriota bacterium]|nr:RdgB/HAM1 family non-canonical purine NTP pyrophosphatase [Candidatus Margulisiibacteriota bacterium]
MTDLKLVLYTNNAHKVAEIKTMFDLPGLEIVSYRDVFRMRIDVVEDGSTFEENALIKVNALPPHPNYIYLAEDSGIEVAALNGAPGIYSARYAGPDATREDMCQKLLKECYGAGNRDAQYQAVMALKFPDENIQTFTGIVRGSLAHEMTGDGGFGYDPIFIPEDYDITFAEMDPDEKNQLSHRYHALMQVKDALIKVKMGAN